MDSRGIPAGFARAGGWRASELRACAGVILVRARGSQPPPPYCKKMQAPLSKNVGIILYINVKYTAYIFVHRCKVYCLHFCASTVKYTAYIFVQRCKVYCLHFCASMHKNVGSILYIDVEKCRQYTLHRCQKSIDVGSVLYIDAQKCRQYTLHRCTKM